MLAFLFSPVGRFGRGKWWLTQLILLVNICIAVFLIIAWGYNHQLIALALALALAVAQVWSAFCANVKRYHDRNKSAWWYLIQFIPIIGGIWTFVELGFCSGDDGDNDYGPGLDFNIEADLKAMKMVGKSDEAYSAPQRATVSPAYQTARAGNNNGSPVFGKRG